MIPLAYLHFGKLSHFSQETLRFLSGIGGAILLLTLLYCGSNYIQTYQQTQKEHQLFLRQHSAKLEHLATQLQHLGQWVAMFTPHIEPSNFSILISPLLDKMPEITPVIWFDAQYKPIALDQKNTFRHKDFEGLLAKSRHQPHTLHIRQHHWQKDTLPALIGIMNEQLEYIGSIGVIIPKSLFLPQTESKTLLIDKANHAILAHNHIATLPPSTYLPPSQQFFAASKGPITPPITFNNQSYDYYTAIPQTPYVLLSAMPAISILPIAFEEIFYFILLGSALLWLLYYFHQQLIAPLLHHQALIEDFNDYHNTHIIEACVTSLKQLKTDNLAYQRKLQSLDRRYHKQHQTLQSLSYQFERQTTLFGRLHPNATSWIKLLTTHCNKQTVVLQDQLPPLLNALKALTAIKQIAFNCTIPANLPTIHTDPLYLEQLLLHAAKHLLLFLSHDHTINFTVHITETLLTFTYQDDGIGLDINDRIHILNRSKLQETALLEEGTLPRPILEHLAYLHQGTLNYYDNYGKGSMIQITLPLGEYSVLPPASIVPLIFPK